MDNSHNVRGWKRKRFLFMCWKLSMSKSLLIHFWYLSIFMFKIHYLLPRHNNIDNIMRKRGVLQLALQLNFWITSDTCNSPYLYAMSAIGQVARATRVTTHCIYGAIHYNLITTLLQQFLFNFYATPLWL